MSDLSVSLDLLHRRQVTIIVYSAAFGTILIDLVSTFPTEVKYIFYPDLKRIHRRWPTLPTLLWLHLYQMMHHDWHADISIISLQTAHPESTHHTSSDTGLHLDGRAKDQLQVSMERSFGHLCNSSVECLLYLYSQTDCESLLWFTSKSYPYWHFTWQAIRNSKRPMICFLVLLLVAHTAAVIYWLFFSTFAPEPFHLSPEITLCSGLQLPAWTWKLCIGFATADLLILCLTLFDQDWRTTKIKFGTVYNVWRSGDSSITQRFYSDTIFYFSIQIVYLYLEAIWIHHYAHDPIYGILPVPMWVFRNRSR